MVGIIDGDITKHSFEKEKLNDPYIKEILSHKTTLEKQDELTEGYPDGIPNRVTLKTRDGKTYTKEVKYPGGHAKNRMSDSEVIEKFRKNTEEILTSSEQDKIVDSIMNLEKCGDVSKLSSVLRMQK